jgi:hypothetical protein
MPSGMLMVTDSAFTVLDEAPGSGFCCAATGKGTVFKVVLGWVCPAAIRLLARIKPAKRLVLIALLFLLYFPGKNQDWHWLPTQCSPDWHVPQITTPPQPSETVPQVKPWQALLFGVQQLFL